MAWNFEQVGTSAALTTAINAMTATSHTGQDSQLARVKTALTSELAAFGTPLMKLTASGHKDGVASVIHIRVEPVEQIAAGVVSKPAKNT